MLLRTIAKATAFMAAGVQVARGQSATDATATTTADASHSITSGSATAEETGSSSTSSESGPTTHTVKVGSGGFRFIPDTLNASVGDTIDFMFFPPDHSVIRAAFGFPCIPYEYVTTDGYPFFSGVQYVSVVTDATHFQITINDTEPIFYYCGAKNSCEQEGMIGVINPNKTHNLQVQKDARSTETIALTPGQPWPTEGNDLTSLSGLAVTATATASSNSSDSDDNGGTHLSAGAIAGIAVGGAAVLVVGGGLLWFCGRKGGMEKGYRKSGMATAGPFTGADAPSDVKYGPANTGTPEVSNFGSVNYGVPPISPGMQSMTSGQSPFPSPGITTPMVGQEGYYNGHPSMTPPPPGMTSQYAQEPVQQSVPVELPTSMDPGNSPLPQYSNPDNQPGRTYSWGPSAEAGYRPGPAEKPA